MRAVTLTLCFFMCASLYWALEPSLAAFAAMRRLGDATLDAPALERDLRRAGAAAWRPLQRGLAADNARRQAYCARLLALSGDRSGDRCLLRMLRQHGSAADDVCGSMAEAFILSVWAERDAPPRAVRQAALQNTWGAAGALTQLLEKYPGWVAGHVLRARLSRQDGDATLARRYALEALSLEPDNFEAMVVLAQACLMQNAHEQAMSCLERAVQVNPRLKRSLDTEIREALKGLDLERARRRREQRRQEPVA
jgi:tetratricopeptide (TPR) repeat protein